jgi:PPIC-type PPIASE domain
VPSNSALTKQATRSALLSTQIKNEWYRQEVRARGIRVPAARTLAEHRGNIFLALMQSELQGKRFRATPTEVRQYYITHRPEFDRSAQRLVSFIEARTRARAVLAARALRQGVSFPAARNRYGQGVPNVTGDRLGLLPLTQGNKQVPPALEKAVFRSAPTKIVGPVRAESIWYVFYITKVTRAKAATLDDARSTIEQALTRQKQNTYFDKFLNDLAAKYRPRTVCYEVRVPECAKRGS